MFIRSLLHDGLHSIVSRAMLLCPPATTLLSSEVTLLYKSLPRHIANLWLFLERLLAERPFSQQYRLTDRQKGQHAFSLVGDSCFGRNPPSASSIRNWQQRCCYLHQHCCCQCCILHLHILVVLQLFYQAANELETFMCKAATQELVDAFVAADPGPAAEDALFGLFAEYMVQNYSAELQTYRCTLNPAAGLCSAACMCVLLVLHA